MTLIKYITGLNKEKKVGIDEYLSVFHNFLHFALVCSLCMLLRIASVRWFCEVPSIYVLRTPHPPPPPKKKKKRKEDFLFLWGFRVGPKRTHN